MINLFPFSMMKKHKGPSGIISRIVLCLQFILQRLQLPERHLFHTMFNLADEFLAAVFFVIHILELMLSAAKIRNKNESTFKKTVIFITPIISFP